MPEVVVYLNEGRSQDQKRELMVGITHVVMKAVGVPAQAVVVTLVETPRHNKAKGGIPFSEMQARPSAAAS